LDATVYLFDQVWLRSVEKQKSCFKKFWYDTINILVLLIRWEVAIAKLLYHAR